MRTFATSCFAWSMCAAAALLAGCGSPQLPAVTSASCAAPVDFTHHTTLRYTGEKQTFKVPSCVTRIQVIANGGSGGGADIAHGGRVSAVIQVTPSQTLAIYVGGAGTPSGSGFNGGGGGGPTPYGDSGYGAGGASDVREGGDALKDRVVVAGGGGGQGKSSYSDGRGGPGGALTGGSGKAGCCKHFLNGGGGGSGGTQLQGGLGGGGYYNPGKSGQLGHGGSGGSGCNPSSCGYAGGGGGGGGGGYYGGGGGGGGTFTGSGGQGDGGGGGGGSSYVESTASDVHLWRGWKNATGNGVVVIRW